MADSPTPIHGRGVLNVTCVVEAALFAGLSVLMVQALRPGFGGGRFVTVALGLSLIFLAIALTRDMIASLAASPRSPDQSAESRRQWAVALRGLVLIVALFGLILLFGTVVGMTAVAFFVLYWHIKARLLLALCGAVVLGIIVPVAFGWAVGIILWPGLAPELVPGWIGGGVLPPL